MQAEGWDNKQKPQKAENNYIQIEFLVVKKDLFYTRIILQNNNKTTIPQLIKIARPHFQQNHL